MKGGEMATLVRWEPFREIAALQNEMSRFMNGLLEGNGRTNQAWVPALDVLETEDEIVYALDLPGIPEDKISVELDDGALTISAERERTQEASDERFYRFERRFGTFSRTFGVPQGVTDSDVTADYKNGDLGQDHEPLGPEVPCEKRGRAILVDDRVDAGEPVAASHDRDPAAAARDRDRARVGERANRVELDDLERHR